MEKNEAVIISGFPGVGKTHWANLDTGYNILDLDSSSYSWLDTGDVYIEQKIRHPHFPLNYINDILYNLDNYDFIFISSHENVRNALNRKKIPYVNVYPSLSLKREYIERYKVRGSSTDFCTMMENNFENFYNSINNDNNPLVTRMELKSSGDTLKDVCDQIMDVKKIIK